MARLSRNVALRLEGLEDRQVLSTLSPASAPAFANPTPQQQYMVELINEARTQPAKFVQQELSNLDADTLATLDYYGVDLNQARNRIASSDPRQPLAWNASLAEAAQGHSDEQAATGIQSHFSANGDGPGQRMTAAGYAAAASSGENVFAYSRSVDDAMHAFTLDWGVSDLGHDRNIQQQNVSDQDSFREVGIGITDSTKPGIGPKIITQDFGSRSGTQADLLGVAFADGDGDDFYTPGEGLQGLAITARNLSTGATTTGQTAPAGNYQFELAPGTYDVEATLNGNTVKSGTVTVGNLNVKWDVQLTPAQAAAAQSRPKLTPAAVVPLASTPRPTISMPTVRTPTPTPTPTPPVVAPQITIAPPTVTTPPSTTAAAATPSPSPRGPSAPGSFQGDWFVWTNSWSVKPKS